MELTSTEVVSFFEALAISLLQKLKSRQLVASIVVKTGFEIDKVKFMLGCEINYLLSKVK